MMPNKALHRTLEDMGKIRAASLRFLLGKRILKSWTAGELGRSVRSYHLTPALTTYAILPFMELSPRDHELLDHYVRFLGPYERIVTYHDGTLPALDPIFIVEFAPNEETPGWRYVTIGMSRQAMPGADPAHRLELLMYSDQHHDEIVDALQALVTYPFVHRTWLGRGHTIAGSHDTSVVADSPLTEFLLTPVYFAADGLDLIDQPDGTHIEVLWATSLYRSEREFVKQHSWQALIERFIDHEVQVADLWRAPVV